MINLNCQIKNEKSLIISLWAQAKKCKCRGWCNLKFQSSKTNLWGVCFSRHDKTPQRMQWRGNETHHQDGSFAQREIPQLSLLFNGSIIKSGVKKKKKRKKMYPWQCDGDMEAFTLKLSQRNDLHFCLRITNKKTSTWCERSDPSVAALILHLWLTRRHGVGTTPTDGSCVPESLKRALVKTLSISRVTARSSHENGGKQRRRFSVCLLLSLFVNSATASASRILGCSEALMMWKRWLSTPPNYWG